jgi:oligopeptide/dipeptide ABC transporter ATP-binding protein
LLLQQVGLSASYMDRYPQQLSGGQCQRIGIARAIAVEPEFIVADEPVSALDVSIQAQVLNLLLDVKDELDLTMLFVSHDLGVVRHISDRIVVLYLGRIMEIASSEQLFATPAHPYTKALIAAAPVPSPGSKRMAVLKGEIPSPLSPPSGCVFRTRCPIASAECGEAVPPLREVDAGHYSACIKSAPRLV